MLCSETIAVCSQIHTKHINTLCGQNVELLRVTPGGTYSDHWDLKEKRQAATIYTILFIIHKLCIFVPG